MDRKSGGRCEQAERRQTCVHTYATGSKRLSCLLSASPVRLSPAPQEHIMVDTNRLRVLKAIRETREADDKKRVVVEPEDASKGKGAPKKK